MVTMTSRERVLKAARREQPDKVPVDINIEGGYYTILREALGDEVLSDILAMKDFAWVWPGNTRQHSDFSQYFHGRHGVEWDEWGRGRIWDNKGQYAEYLYPLADAETVDDLKAYPWPDTDAGYRYVHLADDVSNFQAEGRPALASLGDTLFELAWQLRSMEAFSADLLVNEDMAEYLLDLIARQRIETARQYARAGVDYVILGDDVAMQTGMMMSPVMWRKWFKPRLADVIRAARELKPDIVMSYHSDGDCEAIIPDLIEVGVDVLNPVQPECLSAVRVKATYGDRLAFSGGLGVQSVLPFGTPDEVREHVRTQIETLGAGGGYIVAPSHVLERDVPVANFLAMADAIREFTPYK